MSKVSQKVGVEDILYSPVTVDIGCNDLTLSVKTLGAHGGKKALYFLLVGLGPVSLKNTSSVSSRQAKNRGGSYLGSVPMVNIKIGFVSCLETDDPVTENFLASLDHIQPPVGGVVEWDTFESRIEGH